MKSTNHTPPVALITGSARRIGAIIAKTLHAHDYDVVIHYRHSQSEAEKLCTELNGRRSHSAIPIQANFNVFDDIAHLAQTAQETWGRLDVLVNNASDFFPTAVGKTSEQQWHELINSNLKAPYFLSQSVMPYLSDSKGSIINIIDIHGQQPLKGYSVYSIAKAGLTMMTKALAIECGPHIRVNAIAPGTTLWPENENELSEKQKLELIQQAALKRTVNPEDIASGVLLFIKNSSITGQILNIDCGRHLELSS